MQLFYDKMKTIKQRKNQMNSLKSSIIALLWLGVTGCGSTTYLNQNEVNQENQDTHETYTQKFMNKSNCNQIIDNEFIVMCYDYTKKAVKAVSYTLEGDLVYESNINKRPDYYAEKELPSKYRATTTDYTNSGYDRGHMAPDASFDWSQESLEAVYTLANIIPQAPQVNRNGWADLERYVRHKAVELGKVNVVNVVKYGENSNKIGKNRIAVSIGYYKILYNEEESFEECYYYSNKLGVSSQNDTVENHRVSCSGVRN